MSDNVYVYGVGMIKFGKHLDLGVKQLTGEALKLVLADCGLENNDLEAAWFSNVFPSVDFSFYSYHHLILDQKFYLV